MKPKRILSIGQCAADHYSLASFLQANFSDVVVVPVDTGADALAALKSEDFALVLVNRLLDRDGSLGLEVIRALRADGAYSSVPVMLVSNHSAAQRDAQMAGAERGFGKANLGPEASEAIRSAMGLRIYPKKDQTLTQPEADSPV
jgi:CheY-like chemotaxis protein